MTPKPSFRPIRPVIMDDFVRHLELADRLADRLPWVNAKMLAQLPGDLKGTDYDANGGGSTAWCETHEREVSACLKAGILCRGVPVTTSGDPTGEAAVLDVVSVRLYADAQEITRRVRAIMHEINSLQGVVVRWDVEDPTPDEADERDRKNATVWCERCAQFGFEAPSRTKNGTRVPDGSGGFVLKDARRLCEWHEDSTRKLGRLPNQQETEDHARGKRLRVRVA